MNRKVIFLIGMLLVVKTGAQSSTSREQINLQLDRWHKAAANADYDTYFGIMTDDGVFFGTDALENWQNEAFRTFSKPHFAKGRAWKFTAVQRNIYVDEAEDFA